MQQQQRRQDGRSHEGTGGVGAGATHGLIRAPKVSALPSIALIAVADAPSLHVDSRGAGKTISGGRLWGGRTGRHHRAA